MHDRKPIDLNPGERIVRSDHPHPIILVPSALLTAIFLFITLASGESFIYLLVSLAALNTGWQGWRRQVSRFILTTERFIVISHQGFNQRLLRVYPWSAIFQVASQRKTLGRVMGYGTLILRFDRSQPPVGAASVPSVLDYEEYIRAQVREYAKQRLDGIRENLSQVGSMLEMDAREFEKLL